LELRSHTQNKKRRTNTLNIGCEIGGKKYMDEEKLYATELVRRCPVYLLLECQAPMHGAPITRSEVKGLDMITTTHGRSRSNGERELLISVILLPSQAEMEAISTDRWVVTPTMSECHTAWGLHLKHCRFLEKDYKKIIIVKGATVLFVSCNWLYPQITTRTKYYSRP